MDQRSTILAACTPPGHSPRGTVRLSGDLAWVMVSERIDGDLPRTRGVLAARFRLAELSVPILILRMPGPASYTGEDTLELQLPGHPVLIQEIMTALLEDARDQNRNARVALAGEFTARAFLNQRLDLLEAESVAARVAARSDDEIRAARVMQDGRLRRLVEEATTDLVRVLALVEAGIDFTDEEDVVAITPPALRQAITDVRDRLQNHLERSIGLESLQAIPWVVLEGVPNAGKSTLFNALLGRSRAMVSSQRGTTRDVITEPLRIGDDRHHEVLLVDLAGEEVAETALDHAMQAAAMEARERAELRLICVPPGGDGPSPESLPAASLVIGTQCDRGEPYSVPVELEVSAAAGIGLEALRILIDERLGQSRASLAADRSVLAARHERALGQAVAAMAEVDALIDPGARALSTAELVAGHLREAVEALGTIRGVVSPDDILDEVFSSFCIGK